MSKPVSGGCQPITITAMQMQQSVEDRWQRAIEMGELGVWDLRLDLETVHYSPQWKLRMGFPEPDSADSTHFWRCRVHPEDLPGMLAEMRKHLHEGQPGYEARFRLRSNGSGYRIVHSRGLVIERNAEGRAVRMVGTMVDLTPRPPTPQGGLPEGPRGSMEGVPLDLPFHLLLGAGQKDMDVSEPQRARIALERERVLGLAGAMLRASLAELESSDA